MIFTRDLGTFDSMQAVWNAYPSGGQTGDYLNVNGRIYCWDSTSSNWICYSQPKRSARGAEVFNGDVHIGNNLIVGGILDARVVRGRDAFCGLYATTTALNTYCPNPLVGQWALVIAGRTANSMSLGKVYYCQTDGAWTDAGFESDVASVISQLLAEQSARKTADEELQENIDNEASAREEAITQEQQTRSEADEQEAQARQQGDETLQQSISDEASAREEAITQEQRTRSEADEQEAQARQQADETLQENIDNIDYAVITTDEMNTVLSS